MLSLGKLDMSQIRLRGCWILVHVHSSSLLTRPRSKIVNIASKEHMTTHKMLQISQKLTAEEVRLNVAWI